MPGQEYNCTSPSVEYIVGGILARMQEVASQCVQGSDGESAGTTGNDVEGGATPKVDGWL